MARPSLDWVNFGSSYIGSVYMASVFSGSIVFFCVQLGQAIRVNLIRLFGSARFGSVTWFGLTRVSDHIGFKSISVSVQIILAFGLT